MNVSTIYRDIFMITCGSSIIPKRHQTSSSQSIDPLQKTTVFKKMQKYVATPQSRSAHTCRILCLYHSISVSSNSLSFVNTKVLSLTLKAPAANIYFLPVIVTPF